MTHTPSPTVIEEARKLAEGLDADIEGMGGFYRRDRIVSAFIAAIELGERRAEAAVVGKVREYEAVHRDHSETGKRYRAEAKHHADACRGIADCIERGDHRSKP